METLRVILNIAAEAVLPGGIGWPLRSEAGLFGLKVTADAPQMCACPTASLASSTQAARQRRWLVR
jgi:hypothetical protein